jgi:TRAP transporter TatT component family protein
VTTRALALVVVAVAALGASGCLAKRIPAWAMPPTPFGTVSDDIIDALVADGERAWQSRTDPKALDEAARAFGAALRYRPADPNVLVRLARISMRRSQSAKGAGTAEHLNEATAFAERALAARNDKLREAARGSKMPVQVFAHAEPADAPALVVYAEALLDWTLSYGTPTLLKHRAWISAAATRALAFDPSVGWGAPNRVLGILDCELPEAGQNLRDAQVRFEAAVAAAPAYLPTRVAYAQKYATRVRDRALYKRLLEEVLTADPKGLPEAEPENTEAQRTARSLLGRK